MSLAFTLLAQAIRDVQREDQEHAIDAENRRHEHAKARITDRLELMAECLDHADNMRYLEAGSHERHKK